MRKLILPVLALVAMGMSACTFDQVEQGVSAVAGAAPIACKLLPAGGGNRKTCKNDAGLLVSIGSIAVSAGANLN